MIWLWVAARAALGRMRPVGFATCPALSGMGVLKLGQYRAPPQGAGKVLERPQNSRSYFLPQSASRRASRPQP